MPGPQALPPFHLQRGVIGAGPGFVHLPARAGLVAVQADRQARAGLDDQPCIPGRLAPVVRPGAVHGLAWQTFGDQAAVALMSRTVRAKWCSPVNGGAVASVIISPWPRMRLPKTLSAH